MMEMEPRGPNLCPEKIDSGAHKHFGPGHQTVPIVDAIGSRQCLLLQFELICTISYLILNCTVPFCTILNYLVMVLREPESDG